MHKGLPGPWTRVGAGVTPECPRGVPIWGVGAWEDVSLGAGAGPPHDRVAHKGLLAWGACLPATLS